MMGQLLMDWHGLKISNSAGCWANLDHSITTLYTSDFQGKKTVEYGVFNGSEIRHKELICMTNSMEEQGQDTLHLGLKRMQYVQQRSFSKP